MKSAALRGLSPGRQGRAVRVITATRVTASLSREEAKAGKIVVDLDGRAAQP